MNINKPLLIAICLLLVFGIILPLSHISQRLTIGDSALGRIVEIKPGMSFDEIANQLRAEGVIKSKTFFKIYSLIIGQASQFKPGKYVLSGNISFPQLAQILAKGPSQISVTVIPGMTIKEIDGKLSALGIASSGDLINFKTDSLKDDFPWLEGVDSLEGFLFPDTYDFFVGSDKNLVVRKFLDNFQLKTLPFFENSNNLLKALNLASLLEKEIPDYYESQLVAGILIKRLAANMPLQVDAAVVYAKCDGKFLDCPALRGEDFKIDSLYNTYLYNGLPKGPICNPGPEAIKAALNPQKSIYWYYLSDPVTKKTIFSKTLDEHNENRAKYLIK